MKKFLAILVFIALPLIVCSQEATGCQGGVYNLISPFIGDWEEFTVTQDGEVFIGTLRSARGPDGCTLAQRFVSADGSFAYQSFGYVASTSGLWEEIYVFSNGNNSRYQWFREGEDIIMLRTGGTRQLEHMHRLRLTNISKDAYDVVEEHSLDEGKTWEDKELTRIKRVNP